MADTENSNDSSQNNNSKGCSKSTKCGCALAITCLVLEVISLICTYSFAMQYDESEGVAARASWIIMIISVIGQIFGCCIIRKIGETGKAASEECNCGEILGLALYAMGILSIVPSGLGQIGATAAIIVATANNTASNVIAFGVFIAVLDAVAVLTSISYIYFVYCPVCSRFLN